MKITLKLTAFTAWLLILLGGCSSKASNNAAAPVADTVAAVFTASPDSLMGFVTLQTDLGARTPGSEAHARCVELINSRLRSYGVDTVINTGFDAVNFKGEKLRGTNIFAQINPSAPSRTLLLAHYDTRPWADNDPDPANHNEPVLGANDGASGVAILLEVARTAARLAPDSVGVDLLFVDLEDSGTSGGPETESTWCLGSQHFAENLPYDADNKPQQAVLFDMVGGMNARFHKELFSVKEAPALVNAFWNMGRRSGFASRFPAEVGGGVVDDHLFINRAGIPCIDVIESVNSETGTFNPHWHTVTDDPSSIDPATLRAVAQTALNFLFN